MALIAGPTASGKSALAVALAQALGDAEVVNADASQVYADIPLLSARPDAAEMAGIPHRLFGHVDGGSAHNAARWAEEARRTLSHAHAAGKVPILVGGTGLYLRTLLDGIAPRCSRAGSTPISPSCARSACRRSRRMSAAKRAAQRRLRRHRRRPANMRSGNIPGSATSPPPDGHATKSHYPSIQSIKSQYYYVIDC